MEAQFEALKEPVKVLDHGFVRLVDVMGNDQAVVDAARVSIHGKNVQAKSTDRGLIRYLKRNRHTTPFEMVSFKFHMKMPIFVARQVVRHRTAKINEMSARYSVLPAEYYVPDADHVAWQDPKNKQGRGNKADEDIASAFVIDADSASQSAFQDYGAYLGLQNADNTFTDEQFERVKDNGGIARELARINLPLSTYTEWYWKIDLHNLMHFLSLRYDPHAQYEVRVFAEEIAKIVQLICPLSYEAFEDFVLKAMTLSRQDILAIQRWKANGEIAVEESFPTKSEYEEYLLKFELLFNTQPAD